MNSKNVAWLVTAALAAAPLAAYADSVTYDFTGTVVTPTSGLTSAVAVGTTVMGTYTINLSNATSTTGTVGSTSGFESSENNGTSAYVFSDSLTAGTFSYTTASPGANLSQSNVTGSNSGMTYSGFEQQNSSSTAGTQSSFNISNSSSLAYGSDGLPLTFTSPPAGSNDSGIAQTYGPESDVGIDYTITSLTLASTVPLPAAAWLMFSGLGGLVVIARRRRTAVSPA